MPGIETNETDLIERLRRGDERAVGEIVEQFKNPLFAFILRMVPDHAAAEDIFQETWLRVVRYAGRFRGDSKLSTWIFQIALNLCRDAERKRKRWFQVSIDDYADAIPVKPGFGAEKLLRAQQVREVVNQLPVKMREVMVLKFFHDMDDDEIAEVVGCPVGTVKTRYYRGAKLMKEKWEQLRKSAHIEGYYETV